MRSAQQWEALQDAAEPYDLAGEELGDRQRHDIGRTVDVGDDPARLGARQAADVVAEAQVHLVGVDGVDVEVRRSVG